MVSTSRWIGLLWGFALFLNTAYAAAPPLTPLFYQVELQGKTAWILGSFHVGKANFYPLPPPIMRAFQQSSALVLEADVRDPKISQWVAQYGMQPAEADAPTRKLLDAYCQPLGICQQLAQFSPWLQSIQISMLRFTQMGLSPQFGVEQQLLTLNGARPLLELESTRSQLAMLSSFDMDIQWAMVRDSIEAPDTDIQALVDAWRRGDEATIAKLMRQQLETEGGDQMLDKMLWQRNRQMAERLQQLLAQQSQPLFVAVGSGHLAGDRSLLQYLRQVGANIRNCWQQPCDISAN
ncbi:TraB/GumN family protein [Shewanella sp. A32]|uniref:TraB/GumN family protein n=1 Tax=Shewanella sp. A32 TaxID=3031327 RepID=UPI0023B9D210|nr:TraB/GumN family protein [Shewanella sp. A32]MDF0534736.1 TraB/GumN family protein [Shewanella sp. A32]